jgi:hypothetical protein
MDILQIIVTAGVALITAAAIASYLYNKKSNSNPTQLPTSAAITKDVLDQIVKKAKVLPEDTVIDLETVAKPKKKKKYYPKKPKTQL